MPNFKITIAYKGTHFHGWQIQPSDRTVQGELNAQLRKLFDQEIKTIGASRTDAGVHALGQVASAVLPLKYDPEDLRNRLNDMLPDDISIVGIEPVQEEFSARYSARCKRYDYLVIFEKDPMKMDFALWIKSKPDIEILEKTAKLFLGKHDFSAFTRLESLPEDPRCEISEARWSERENGLTFSIVGDRFLHTMVRSIVGASLDCARGRFSIKDLEEMIDTGKRLYDYKVVEPKGLWLMQVYYT